MNAGKVVVMCVGACIIAAFVFVRPLRFFENVFYDFNFAFASSRPAPQVTVVGIDPVSIGELGAWPWPRGLISRCVEKIGASAPAALAVDILFPPRRDNPSGNDSLAAALCGVKNLVLPYRAGITRSPRGMAGAPRAVSVHPFLVLSQQDRLNDLPLFCADRIDASDSAFSRCAQRSGFMNVTTSASSQKLRHLVQVIKMGNEYYPSFSLCAAAAFLDCRPDEFVLNGNGFVAVKGRRVPLSSYAGTTPLHFRGRAGTIATVSAADVIRGNVDPSLLRDRLVFLGVTDAGVGADFFTTPVGAQFSGVEVWATGALDILEEAWVREDGPVAQTANILFAFLLFPGLLLIFPDKKGFTAAGTALLTTASVAFGFFFFRETLFFWNPAYHIVAALFTIGVLAGQKNMPFFADGGRLDFSLPQGKGKDSDAIAPPGEHELLETLPHTDSAQWVARQMRNAVVGNTVHALEDTLADAVTQSGNAVSSCPRWPAEHPRGVPDAAGIAGTSKGIELGGGRIVRLIGSGGMADVYQVWMPRLEVYRAMKVLKPDRKNAFESRFETEIRILSKLAHPHIVQFFGVGDWSGLPFIEMEFVPGSSMDDVLTKCGVLSPRETLAAGIIVCRALHYAHTQSTTIYGKTYDGVIHRDLKPANIMLSKSGKVKLTDFGIARPGEVSLHTLDAGHVVGTLPYLAPEQFDEGEITAGVDIYALGATLYELATGERAFPQTDLTALVKAKATGRIKPPPASLPPGLAAAVGKAMALRPEERYATAQAMEKDLEKALRPMLTPEKPASGIFRDLAGRYFG